MGGLQPVLPVREGDAGERRALVHVQQRDADGAGCMVHLRDLSQVKADRAVVLSGGAPALGALCGGNVACDSMDAEGVRANELRGSARIAADVSLDAATRSGSKIFSCWAVRFLLTSE